MELNFRSDNEAPAAGKILDSLLEANRRTAWSYGEDQWSNRLDGAFSELFGTQTTVIPVSTGTAANSIALACVTPPWGSVFCHRGAHILTDECGAPEFFGNGLRMVGVDGENGKMVAAHLRESIRRSVGHGVHSYQPTTISMTQITEAGTVYEPAEIAALSAVAKEFQLTTHMDGARFANAVAALGCSPADSSWASGVDLLSFGASKNGCFGAEALLIFGETNLRERAERLRKRSGHLLSKMRYVSAQLLAYIEDGLWLELAGHANRQAAQFVEAVKAHPEARLESTAGANEIFVRWTPAGFAALEKAGIQFFLWPGYDDLARFVFSFQTTEEETVTLCEALRRSG